MKKIKILLTVILMLVIGAATYARGQTDSPTPIPNSVLPTATPPIVNLPAEPNDAVPAVLKDPKILQQILARAEFDRKRADANELAAQQWKDQAGKWEGVANKAVEENEKLRSSNTNLEKSNAEMKIANGYLQTSVTEYKTEVQDLRREVEKQRGQKKWYAAGGALAGFGACSLRRQ